MSNLNSLSLLPERGSASHTDDDIKIITLISSDSVKFEIETKYTNVSSTIKNALTSKGEKEVPVMVDSKCLKYIIDYMKLKKGEENKKKIPDTLYKSLEETFDHIDLEFIKEISKDKQILFNTALAANWLGMNYLLELTCAAIAFQTKQRKNPAMVKKYFDLNEVEEKKMIIELEDE